MNETSGTGLLIGAWLSKAITEFMLLTRNCHTLH